MSDYYVFKREKCRTCNGKGFVRRHSQYGLQTVRCSQCLGGGELAVEVDLDEAFREFCQLYQLPLEEPE